MKILIILAHPDAKSFNHAIARAIRDDLLDAGHDVLYYDLYEEGFDPLLPIEEIPASGQVHQEVDVHCRALSSADGIIIVHPNWWGQPPAILKGWLDRVFRPGVAYRFEEGDNGEGVPVGLLKASAAVVINTSNTPADREQAAFGDPLDALWRRCVFDLCGVTNFRRRMFSVVVTSTLDQRLEWMEEAIQLCRRVFEPPAGSRGLFSDKEAGGPCSGRQGR
jgi:putative NADPH-quinone reductase